jgi:succinate-acetate transporter protein
MATPVERWTPAGPIKTAVPEGELEHTEAVTKASAAEAAPWGLVSFATGTFTVSAILARWFPPTDILFATVAVFIVGGIAQFIAAMWSFRKGDTLAATAFGSFGAFNMMFSLQYWLSQTHLIVGTTQGYADFGIAIACFSLIAGGLMVAAMWRNLALVAVLGWLSLAYGLEAAGVIAGFAPNLLDFGGWAGIASSLLAFYTAIVMVVNSEARRQVLPLGKPIFRQATPPAPTPTMVERPGWQRPAGT